MLSVSLAHKGGEAREGAPGRRCICKCQEAGRTQTPEEPEGLAWHGDGEGKCSETRLEGPLGTLHRTVGAQWPALL